MCVHGQNKLGKFTWVKRKCEYIEATGPLDDVKVVFKGLLGIRGGTATCVAFQNVFVLSLPKISLSLYCLCLATSQNVFDSVSLYLYLTCQFVSP